MIAIDGQPVATWEFLLNEVLPKANKPITLGVQRDGQLVDVRITPKAVGKFEAGELGILPEMHPEITAVNGGEAAHRRACRPTT